jgi:hypothetical protein
MSEPKHGAAGAAVAHEQRREPRRPASGAVRVMTPRGPVNGRLVDVSYSGFRMSHQGATLETGQVLEFRHGGAAGRARVIWNRIVQGRTETGFFIEERR